MNTKAFLKSLFTVKFSPENNDPSEAKLFIKEGISKNEQPKEINLKGN